MNAISRENLFARIAELPDDRISEVATFVEFVRSQEAERSLVRAAMGVSEPSLNQVWDNPEDDVYNAY